MISARPPPCSEQPTIGVRTALPDVGCRIEVSVHVLAARQAPEGLPALAIALVYRTVGPQPWQASWSSSRRGASFRALSLLRLAGGPQKPVSFVRL